MINNKPKIYCNYGEYNCTIPMPIKGRVRYIDLCIADIVAALNAANIITTASCCGHRKQNGIISLEDGREIIIKLGELNIGYGTRTPTSNDIEKEPNSIEPGWFELTEE